MTQSVSQGCLQNLSHYLKAIGIQDSGAGKPVAKYAESIRRNERDDSVSQQAKLGHPVGDSGSAHPRGQFIIQPTKAGFKRAVLLDNGTPSVKVAGSRGKSSQTHSATLSSSLFLFRFLDWPSPDGLANGVPQNEEAPPKVRRAHLVRSEYSCLDLVAHSP